MLTDLLLVRAALGTRLNLEAAGRVNCWWGAIRRGLRW
jgi:hypothetical protein